MRLPPFPASMLSHQQRHPLSLGGGDSYVYTDSTTDFRPTNFAADAMNYHISPATFRRRHYFLAAATSRSSDDKTALKWRSSIALCRQSLRFRRTKLSAAISNSGAKERAEVVGVVEDGKYAPLTEDQEMP